MPAPAPTGISGRLTDAASGAFTMALDTVDKVAGHNTRAKVERGVDSITESAPLSSLLVPCADFFAYFYCNLSTCFDLIIAVNARSELTRRASRNSRLEVVPAIHEVRCRFSRTQSLWFSSSDDSRFHQVLCPFAGRWHGIDGLCFSAIEVPRTHASFLIFQRSERCID